MHRELTATAQPIRSQQVLNRRQQEPAQEWREETLQAYVLIQTEANREPIAETVRGIAGVISAEDLSGPFDAIALAGSASTRSLTEQIVAEIQKIPGVIRALSAPLIGSIGPVRAVEPGNRYVAA